MRGMTIMTQVCCLETMARIPLSISVNPMTSAAARNPPRTPPSAEVPILEGNVERPADASCSFMEFLQVPLRGRLQCYVASGGLRQLMYAERLRLVRADPA